MEESYQTQPTTKPDLSSVEEQMRARCAAGTMLSVQQRQRSQEAARELVLLTKMMDPHYALDMDDRTTYAMLQERLLRDMHLL